MPDNDDRARELFRQALDQQPDRMVTLLEDACGGKDNLLERVQRLLEAPHDDGEFPAPSHMKETVIREVIEPDFDDFPETTESVTLTPGTAVGPYKLLEPIGEGGMGSVWVASQSKPIKRKVAIKLIKAGMDSGQVLARFEAERQALAMMDHPNIARVLDGGMTEQGRPYFAMEYVKGVPLTEYCDSARLSLKERLELFVPVCQAVQHAHQKGIIHRDLKPSNILVCLYDGKPVPKVIDFGLAKAMHQSLTDESIYTAHGMMVGTPLYMSPEQAEHNNLDIDTRTDIYALGVILYELLTGTTPLERAQFKEAAYVEVLRLIKEVEPPKPSTRLSGSESLPSVAAQRSIEPAQLTRSITGDLDWVVMKALEKERSRRYETANSLADDVRRHLCDEPVSASPPSTSYRMKKFIRRNRAGVIAVSAIAVTLLLGVAGTTGGMLWALSERREAVDARKAETESKRIAENNAEVAIAAAVRATAAEQLARNETERATEAERRTTQTLKQVETERDAKEEARQESEQLYERMTKMFAIPDSALEQPALNPIVLLDSWGERLKSDFANRPDQLIKSQAVLGKTYLFLKAYSKAIAVQEKVKDYHLAHSGADSIEALRALLDLAYSHNFAGSREDALNTLQEAYSISRDVRGSEHPDTLVVMNSLALALEHFDHKDEALDLLEDTLEISRRVNGIENVRTIVLMANLGTLYRNRGRHEESLNAYKDSVMLLRKVLGSEHPMTQTNSGMLLSALQSANRNEEALRLREEILTLTGQALATRSSTSEADLDGYTNKAISLAAQQVWDARTTEYSRLVQQLFDVVSQAQDARALERVAKISSLVPDTDPTTQQKAVQLARKAQELGKDDAVFQRWARMALGMTLYRAGNYADAEKVLAEETSLDGDIGGTTAFFRAMALFKKGDGQAARDLFVAARMEMKPLPEDSKDPLNNTGHDQIIVWIAYREADALINK